MAKMPGKQNDFSTYQATINPQGQIKLWKAITDAGNKIHWMIYFQTESTFKEANIIINY